MAFINQNPSWVFSATSINGVSSSSKTNLLPSTNFFQIRPFRTLTISASSSLNDDDSSNGEEPATTDPVKLAFARARLYKKSKQEQTQNPLPDSGNGNGVVGSESKIDGVKEIPDSVKLAMERAKEYKKNKGAALGSSSSVGEKDKVSGLEEVDSRNSGYGVSEKSVNEKDKLSVPSIAFVGLNFSDKKKSRGLPAGLAPLVETYTDEDLPEVEFIVGDATKFGPRKSSQLDSNTGDDSEDSPVVEFLVGDASKFGPRKSSQPDSNTGEDSTEVEFIAGDASKFGPRKSSQPDSNTGDDSPEVEFIAGDASKFGPRKSSEPDSNTGDDSEDLPEVEFIAGDASKFGPRKSSQSDSNTGEDSPEVEFIAGDASKFGPRKSSQPDSNMGDDSPEVEFIAGDASKFGPRKSSEPDSNTGDDSDVYKPKVSTWGVFPRPSNISKAYGGGKTIRAGEVLETEEEKAAKEARTRKLLAAYKSKTGLVVDPKLKAECEKTLKDGDKLMDIGKLKQALPYYEKVMKELPFQTELHGLAALQWSICQDSLTRQGEARVMYEKLQSHPNAQVKKKASQFLFAFEAMVMLKVTSSSLPSTTEGYRPYFEAFVEDKTTAPLKVGTTKGDEEEKEGTFIQALPYMILLVSPILIVLLIAVQKRI